MASRIWYYGYDVNEPLRTLNMVLYEGAWMNNVRMGWHRMGVQIFGDMKEVSLLEINGLANIQAQYAVVYTNIGKDQYTRTYRRVGWVLEIAVPISGVINQIIITHTGITRY